MSEFFKNLFRRDSAEPRDKPRFCYSCDVDLKPEPMGPRLLERCPECRGIWLSQSQLQEIVGQVSHKADECEESRATVESDGHADIPHTFAPSRIARKCPECGDDMDNYRFEDTGIWIDACPQGHGIWLDNGELRLIAQRSKSSEDNNEDVGTVIDAVSDLILGSL